MSNSLDTCWPACRLFAFAILHSWEHSKPVVCFYLHVRLKTTQEKISTVTRNREKAATIQQQTTMNTTSPLAATLNAIGSNASGLAAFMVSPQGSLFGSVKDLNSDEEQQRRFIQNRSAEKTLQSSLANFQHLDHGASLQKLYEITTSNNQVMTIDKTNEGFYVFNNITLKVNIHKVYWSTYKMRRISD